MKRFCIPLILLASMPWVAVAATPSTKEIHKAFALDANGEVSIDTFKGSVVVNTADQPQVKIDARIEPDDSCGDASEHAKRVEQTDVRIDATSNAVHIKSDYSKMDESIVGWLQCSSRPFVHYQITAPRTARLSVTDHKSTIKIADAQSKVKVHTHKGEVELRGLTGSLDLQTHKGHAVVAFAKLTGPTRVETHKGDIELTLPKSTGFSLDANLGRRAHLDSDFPVPALVESRRHDTYKATVNGGGPELQLESHRGTFTLKQR